MSDSGSVTVPAYDGEGRLLEYRWVETTVTKGGEKVQISDENDDGSVTFTLDQQPNEGGDPQTVTYRSTAETVNNSTTVTNRVKDDVDFALKKVWKDKDGIEITDPEKKDDITLNIYQTLSGTEFDFTAPFVQVKIPRQETRIWWTRTGRRSSLLRTA